jgi:tetratricopeptide (TPR) repeat protein
MKRISLVFLVFFLVIVIFSSPKAYTQVNKYFDMADRLILAHEYQNAINQYFKGMTLYSGRTRGSARQQTRVWDDIGYAYLQLGDNNKAVDNLTNALSFHPFNYNARFYLAIAHLLNKDYDLAQTELATIENDIFFENRWINSADIFRKRNGRILDRDEVVRVKNKRGVFLDRIDTGEVIVHLDAFDPKNEGAFYYFQGMLFGEKGELLKAEEKFHRALEAHYDEVDARLRLAELFIEQGRFEEAEVQLNLVSKLELDNAETIGLMKFVRDRIRLKAIAASSRKVNLHHSLKDHHNTLLAEWHYKFFKVLKEGRIKDAISVLEEALRIDERSFVINHNLALTCYDVAQLEDPHTEYLAKAEYYCARAIWLNDFVYVSKEYEAGIHDLMGNIYFYQSRYNDAMKEFLKSLEIDPNDPYVLCNLGMAYYNLNDWVLAAEEWKKAIESEKSYVKPKEKANKGKNDELQYVVTVSRKPISHRAHVFLGILYRKQDLIDKSLEHYEKATAIEPENPAPYFDLGKIYQMKGKKEMALKYYEKYLYHGGKDVEETQKRIGSLKKK